MPKPTEAHQKLAVFAGRWSGQEKCFFSPGEPMSGDAIGRCDNRSVADGLAYVHDYEMEHNGAVNFRGHGVFSYDSASKSYLLHWWDNMDADVNVYKGDFKGNTLQMICATSQGTNRVTWEFSGADHCTFRLENSPDGKQWWTMRESDYKRVK